MKTGRFVVLLIVIIAILGLYAFVSLPQDNSSRDLTVKVKTINEVTDLYKIHAEYLEFPGLPKEFSRKISSDVIGWVNDFKNTAVKNEEARQATAEEIPVPKSEYTLNINWDKEQINDRYISLLFTFEYYSGGAHGGEEFLAYNYDIRAEREINLDDVFFGSDNPEYLQKMSSYAITAIANEQRSRGIEPNMDFISSGALPDKENFNTFTFSNYDMDTITLHFEPYQVAPYAYGSSRVIVPVAEIIDKQ